MMELWPVKFCRNSPSGHFHTLMLSGEAVAKEYLTTTTCNQVSFQKLICLFQTSNSKTVAAELFRGGGGFKAGADLGFSRGGGGFSKNFRKF